MQSAISPVSRILTLVCFLSVSSSAGLQWVGLAAQAEAARRHVSRQTLTEFGTLLTAMETASEEERAAAAARLAFIAERLAGQAREELLEEASRRVGVLASYQPSGDKELRERLSGEIRGLVMEAEAVESQALGRATWLATINQLLLLLASAACGVLLFRCGRISRQT
jgi:hypothetical protein